jgi:hypothetical protein
MLAEHRANTCPVTRVPCPHDGCLKEMPRSELSHHVSVECELRIVVCKGHSAGCAEGPMLANLLKTHEATCASAELVDLRQKTALKLEQKAKNEVIHAAMTAQILSLQNDVKNLKASGGVKRKSHRTDDEKEQDDVTSATSSSSPSSPPPPKRQRTHFTIAASSTATSQGRTYTLVISNDENVTFQYGQSHVIRCHETNELLLNLSWMKAARMHQTMAGNHDTVPGVVSQILLKGQGGKGRLYGTQAFFVHLRQCLVEEEEGGGGGSVHSPYFKQPLMITRADLDQAQAWFAQATASLSSSTSAIVNKAVHPIFRDDIDGRPVRVFNIKGAYWVSMNSDALRFIATKAYRKTTYGHCKQLCPRNKDDTDKVELYLNLYQEELLAEMDGPNAQAFRSKHFTCGNDKFEACVPLAHRLLAIIAKAKAQ